MRSLIVFRQRSKIPQLKDLCYPHYVIPEPMRRTEISMIMHVGGGFMVHASPDHLTNHPIKVCKRHRIEIESKKSESRPPEYVDTLIDPFSHDFFSLLCEDCDITPWIGKWVCESLDIFTYQGRPLSEHVTWCNGFGNTNK